MIKTLRITSIIATVLAAVFLISLVFFGTGSNKQVEEFLKSEGVIEKFNKTEDSATKRSRTQTSPLVTQAMAFAKYLNPPPKPKPPRSSKPPVARKPSAPKPRPAKSSAKFTLIGTSYYASQPERSLAFIDEPGKGMRWVSQSSKVGHLVVENVKDGVVIVRDGGRTFELSVPETKQRNLIEGASSAVKKTISESIPTTSTHTPTDALDLSTAEEIEKMEKLLKALQASVESSEGADSEITSGLGSMRISSDEAERLKELPQELENAQQPMERITADPNQTRSRKIQRPRRPRKPVLPRKR